MQSRIQKVEPAAKPNGSLSVERRPGALGIVRSSSPSIPSQQSRFLLYMQVQIAANSKEPISIPGDFIFVDGIFSSAGGAIGLTAATAVTLQPDTGTPVPITTAGARYEFAQPFNTVELANPNASVVILKLYIGFGRYTPPWGAAGVAGAFGGTGVVTATEGTKIVASAAVPEALSAVSLLARVVDLKALLSNTTDLFYGFSAGNGTQMWRLQPGEWKSLRAPDGKAFDLAAIFIDVSLAGEGVVFNAFN